MADIREYRKYRQDHEQKRDDYRDRIFRHKMNYVYRILALVVVLALVVLVIRWQYNTHVYTSYDTLSSLLIESSAGAEDVRLQDAVLTYSKDGAHCTDNKGTVTWNQTYEIQDVCLAVCQDVVAIASYDGRTIYLQSTTESLGTVTTTMPISAVTVAANGMVTAVLSDTDTTWINTYDTSGEMLFTGQTHMDKSGYPAALSLSPNGNLLAVAYIYLDAGEVKTNLTFYNFGEVGENNSDHVVSGYTLTDVLVPEVCFLDDETLVAVGDDSLRFYKGSQTPTELCGYLLDAEIRSVFYGEGYVGIVQGSDDAEHTWQLLVYNTSGKKIGTYYFDLDYTDIFFEENDFVIYNETECLIETFGGLEKYQGQFDQIVELMVPVSGAYKYLLVTESTMDTIQLK